jgi:hypothetical protein
MRFDFIDIKIDQHHFPYIWKNIVTSDLKISMSRFGFQSGPIDFYPLGEIFLNGDFGGGYPEPMIPLVSLLG